MGHALRQRGHTVHFLTCSGLPNCGMAPMPMENHEAVCQHCRDFSCNVLPRLRHTAEYFQLALTGKEKAEIEDWAQALSVAELDTACYAGLPLGQWTRADIISRWHTLEPQMDRPEVVESYRLLLIGAAMAAAALPRIYDRQNPSVVVTLNGSFFLNRVAVEIARARGIRVILHERGWMDNTVGFITSGIAGDMAGYQERWDAWKDIPLSASELEAVAALLHQRRRGVNMNWSAFSPLQNSKQDREQINTMLGMQDRPLALLCTSSDCEGSLADRARAIDQREWIAQTVDWFYTNPQFNLVVRVHPNEADHALTDDRVLHWYRALVDRLDSNPSDNVRIILPDEKISTYALMDVAAVGLSYGSTAGLEMACQGIPLVHAGMGYYKDCGFTHEIRSAADIPGVMAHVMDLNRCSETQRLAFRFMQRLFIDICVPFSKVKISRNYFQAELVYQSIAELAPGRDPHLDRIAEYILGSAPLYAAPTAAESARSVWAEDAFFAGQNTGNLITTEDTEKRN